MKKEGVFLILTLLLISVASADILFQSQPGEIYNLGDHFSIPTKITTTNELNEFLSMNILCNGEDREFFREYIVLSSGEEKQVNPSVLLIRSLIGASSGDCKIKATLGDNYELTNEFYVSNTLEIQLKEINSNYNPGENITISGETSKINQDVQGSVEIIFGEKTISNTIKNGHFEAEIPILKNEKAGDYTLRIKAYEKDSKGDETNVGFSDIPITISQIPTNLEIDLETKEVIPGENIQFKAILRDQTGENIPSNAIITLKNERGKIIDQKNVQTGELESFEIAYNQEPQEWIIYGVSNKLDTESHFRINEKQEVSLIIRNKTLEVTNIGNILYNKTVFIDIGDTTLNIPVNLKVDESKEYILSAPEGEYEVKISLDGEDRLTQNVLLTGNAISIREAGRALNFAGNPIIWIFILIIFAIVALMIYRKGLKRIFWGSINNFKSNKKAKQEEELKMHSETFQAKKPETNLIETNNPADLSLSIKGQRQEISLINLRLKNIEEINKNKEKGIKETLKIITALAEKEKAYIYENTKNIFFMFVPGITKTFQNEVPAVKLAQKINTEIQKHNKMMQSKIDYGISVNTGEILAKKEGEVLQFMSLGNIIPGSKKIADLANREVLLTKKFNEKVLSKIKTEKIMNGEIPTYRIIEIREKEENKKFISNFVNRLEKGNK